MRQPEVSLQFRIFRIITPTVGFLLCNFKKSSSTIQTDLETAYVKQYFHETSAMKPCRVEHNRGCFLNQANTTPLVSNIEENSIKIIRVIRENGGDQTWK